MHDKPMSNKLAVLDAMHRELNAQPRNELAIQCCELFLAVVQREMEQFEQRACMHIEMSEVQ